MDLPDYRRIPRLRAILLAGLHLCGPAYGQVTADTTGATGLGSVVNGMSDFEISGGLQPPNSTNLFHSFREFDLTSTQSATFTGPASVQNIISRVTGRDGANNDGSNLDGRLGSDIPGANLWFFNPAGIAFGPNATLDVQGSFHVSTGDSVTLKGAARFDKDMSQQQILELAAKPQAFGFLTEPEGFGFSMDNPEQVSIEGSVLSVSEPGESNTLSIIGGDVAVAGGTPAGAQQRRGAELIADDGRINIASVSSPGDVRLTAEGIETSEGQQLGFIDIRDSSFVDAVSGEQPDEAATGGSLFVRGGKFVLDNSVISVSSIGSDPGEIDIRVDDLTVDNGAVIDANTLGDEGDFTDAHLITIAAANSVTVSNGGKITSDTNGGTDGGITRIEANEISVADTRDPGEITGDEQRSQISSSATASGGGGFLIVTAREGLSVSGGGRINADTLRSDGGAIRIAAREVAVSEGQISSDVNKDGEGTGGGIGGDIELAVTGGVSVSAGGQISSDTFGDGPGGSVVVDANSVTLSGGGVIGSDARGEGLGQGGDVTLAVNGELRIQDPGSEISSTTRGIGAGGSVRVTADRIAVSSGGAISVASTNTDSDVDAGFAGDLTISATDSLRMDNGKIDATSVRAGGGSISIEVANTILLVDSSISATAGGEEPRHNGGDLAIDPTFVILSNSFLSANAADGNGGDISIVAANFLTDNRSDINASSQFGSPGFIEVEAPTNDIGTTVTILDVSFVDLAKLLGQRCTPAALKERSSFVVEGRGGLPLSPEAVAATPIEEIVSEVAGSGGGAAKVPTYAHVGPVDDTAHLHVFACT